MGVGFGEFRPGGRRGWCGVVWCGWWSLVEFDGVWWSFGRRVFRGYGGMGYEDNN